MRVKLTVSWSLQRGSRDVVKIDDSDRLGYSARLPAVGAISGHDLFRSGGFPIRFLFVQNFSKFGNDSINWARRMSGCQCSHQRRTTPARSGNQSFAVIVHMPLGALVVPVPTVSVVRSCETWPSWKR